MAETRGLPVVLLTSGQSHLICRWPHQRAGWASTHAAADGNPDRDTDAHAHANSDPSPDTHTDPNGHADCGPDGQTTTPPVATPEDEDGNDVL